MSRGAKNATYNNPRLMFPPSIRQAVSYVRICYMLASDSYLVFASLSKNFILFTHRAIMYQIKFRISFYAIG